MEAIPEYAGTRAIPERWSPRMWGIIAQDRGWRNVAACAYASSDLCLVLPLHFAPARRSEAAHAVGLKPPALPREGRRRGLAAPA
jgi:hypothetical protein